MHGGGQERGLRPGTLPVHLIAGLGLAAELAMKKSQERLVICLQFRERLLQAFKPLNPTYHGDQDRVLPHIINFSLPGLDSEDAMELLIDEVAISNGSACTSQSLTCSHVLGAMKMQEKAMEGAMRWSWSHMTPEPNWNRIVQILAAAPRDAAAGSSL
jgi:cysteine desulfurase